MKKLSLAILISCIGVAGAAMAQGTPGSAASSTHGPTTQNTPPYGGGEGGDKEIGGMPRAGSPNESNSTGNPGDKADTSGASGTAGTSSSTSSPSSSDTSGTSSGKTSIDSTRGMSSDKGESGTPGDRTKRHNPPTQ